MLTRLLLPLLLLLLLLLRAIAACCACDSCRWPMRGVEEMLLLCQQLVLVR